MMVLRDADKIQHRTRHVQEDETVLFCFGSTAIWAKQDGEGYAFVQGEYGSGDSAETIGAEDGKRYCELLDAAEQVDDFIGEKYDLVKLNLVSLFGTWLCVLIFGLFTYGWVRGALPPHQKDIWFWVVAVLVFSFFVFCVFTAIKSRKDKKAFEYKINAILENSGLVWDRDDI